MFDYNHKKSYVLHEENANLFAFVQGDYVMAMTVASIHALSARLREIGANDSAEVYVGCPNSGIKGAPAAAENIVSIKKYNPGNNEPEFFCLNIAGAEHRPPSLTIDKIISELK